MTAFSAGWWYRSRKRGLLRTAQLAIKYMLNPVSLRYHQFRTRNAPVYKNPSEAELIQIEHDLSDLGISVLPLILSRTEFDDFCRKFSFPSDYHGGMQGGVYEEKLLEHFIAYKCCGIGNFGPEDIYIDVAAGGSPWAKILRDSGINSFAIDLDIHPKFRDFDYYCRTNATDTFFNKGSVNSMSLQCAFEMFGGDDDWRYLEECGRILKKGGTVTIAPLYMHTHHCGYSSPDYWKKGWADEGAVQYVRNGLSGIPFSRKYDANLLKDRILDRLTHLGMTYTLYKLVNKAEMGKNIYCHFVLVFNKK